MITPPIAIILQMIAAGFFLSSAHPAPEDSALLGEVSDSLRALQETGRQSHLHSTEHHGPFSIPTAALFSADAPVPSEALSLSPLCLPVRYGLSNRLNRFLLYGHVAPIMAIAGSGPLIVSAPDQLGGTDDRFTTEIDSIVIAPGNRVYYVPAPGAMVTPEASIFWETGVFDGNIFAFRFSRPLSHRLAVNVFSNYRSFAGRPFSHDGNGIYEFYRSLVADTSTIVNRGYNPGINDYASGIQTVWSGKGGGSVRCGITYGDEESQYPLDRPGAGSLPAMGRINRYRSSGNLESSSNRLGPVVLDLEGRIDNSSIIRRALSDSGVTRRSDGLSRTIAGAVRAGTLVKTSVSPALVYRISRVERRPFIEQESSAFRQSGTLEVGVPMEIGPGRSVVEASAGGLSFSARDSLAFAPMASAAWTFAVLDYRVRAYASHSAIPWSIPYDTALFAIAPFLDRYTMAGGEVEAGGAAGGLVLGCQSVLGVERGTVLMAWPDTILPCGQAGFTALVAPRLGPWRGVSVSSRTFVSSARPFVKTRGLVKYTVHPANTGEHVDIGIWCDYWSAREPVWFAGDSGWNRPILDVGMELAVQASSFRFFGKIDNLLNRKFAYIPGYYSPGLTFRWGIGWYLQK
ncbi:MAG: hypothetical protein JXA71_18200 [Chitinispirillaceae bacterium]|nr:hypothetical protein [Chitinispirillaceae bacterium]